MLDVDLPADLQSTLVVPSPAGTFTWEQGQFFQSKTLFLECRPLCGWRGWQSPPEPSWEMRSSKSSHLKHSW